MEKASAFIHKAARDAHFYGSRQRKVQLSAVMPLIEGQRGKQIQHEKNKLLNYAIGITVSCLLLVALVTIIIKQFRTSKKQQAIIHKKNVSLESLVGEKDALLHEKDGLLAEKEHLLLEKERLLWEIHHRVKNNPQIVMSLLNSQADLLQDQAALLAIQESQHRVQAMALIHQKLYQAEGVARIHMPAYIEELVAYLTDSYRLEQGCVTTRRPTALYWTSRRPYP
jgi:two-component sensor histidine kinase